MTSHNGTLTIEQGIETPVKLIELPFEVQNGQGGMWYDLHLGTTFE